MDLELIKASIGASIVTYEMMAEDSLGCSSTDPTESMRQWEGGRAAAYQQAADTLQNKLDLVNRLIERQEEG